AGANHCTFHISWAQTSLAFPIVVDPAWSTTDTLMTPRYQHAAELLPNGELLVAGGISGDASAVLEGTRTVEIYSGGVWATGASMVARRFLAGDAVLANGDILMSGGLDQDASGQTVLDTAEIYSIADGTWSLTGSLQQPRAGHTATPVGDGTVILAGGYDNTPDHFATTELFSGGSFTSAGSINTERFYHSAITLSGNRVLLGGGTDPFTGALGTLEMYTAGVGWSAAAVLAPMTSARTLATATLVGPDKVVFIGGYNKAEDALGSAETYDVATNTWTTSTGRLAVPRYYHAAAPLADGRVLIAGGSDDLGPLADGELYDPATTTFEAFCGMSVTRAFGQSASLLPTGNVLVTGGYTFPPARVVGESDLFDPSLDGGADAGACLRDFGDAGVDAGADAGAGSGAPDAGHGTDGGARSDAGAKNDAGSSGSVPVSGKVRGDASFDDGYDSLPDGEACNAAPGHAPSRTSAGLMMGLVFGWIVRRRRQRPSAS
ncbi:MAG: kelch repeat-containing protein, partial [Polyangiaceae bacterium]